MGTSNVTLYALWDTPTTLYVNVNDTGSTCADATTNACPTIQDAITKAESLQQFGGHHRGRSRYLQRGRLVIDQ